MAARLVKQVLRDPDFVGLNGVTFASARTSNKIVTMGWEEATVEIQYTNGAASDVQMYVEVTDDVQETRGVSGSAVWKRLQAISVASGTITSSDATWVKAVTGDKNWDWSFPLNYGAIRLVFDGTSGDATDSIIVRVRLKGR